MDLDLSFTVEGLGLHFSLHASNSSLSKTHTLLATTSPRPAVTGCLSSYLPSYNSHPTTSPRPVVTTHEAV